MVRKGIARAISIAEKPCKLKVRTTKDLNSYSKLKMRL